MRRFVIDSLLAALLMFLIAAPALAHPGARDPFQPLVTEEQATTTETGEEQTTQQTTETEAFQENGSDALANTGSDVTPWLAVAYGLLVCGGAAIALARINSARFEPPRRRA